MKAKWMWYSIVALVFVLGTYYVAVDGIPVYQKLIFWLIIAAAMVGAILIIFFKATTDANRRKKQD